MSPQSPEALKGKWQGNDCCCTPSCIRLEIMPACCGGICALKYIGDCPIPFHCSFMPACTDCAIAGVAVVILLLWLDYRGY